MPTASYTFVLFPIMVQGLTVAKAAERAGREPEPMRGMRRAVLSDGLAAGVRVAAAARRKPYASSSASQ